MITVKVVEPGALSNVIDGIANQIKGLGGTGVALSAVFAVAFLAGVAGIFAKVRKSQTANGAKNAQSGGGRSLKLAAFTLGAFALVATFLALFAGGSGIAKAGAATSNSYTANDIVVYVEQGNSAVASDKATITVTSDNEYGWNLYAKLAQSVDSRLHLSFNNIDLTNDEVLFDQKDANGNYNESFEVEVSAEANLPVGDYPVAVDWSTLQKQAPLEIDYPGTPADADESANAFGTYVTGGSGTGEYTLASQSEEVCAVDAADKNPEDEELVGIDLVGAGECALTADKAGDDEYADAVTAEEFYNIYSVEYKGLDDASYDFVTERYILEDGSFFTPFVDPIKSDYDFEGWCTGTVIGTACDGEKFLGDETVGDVSENLTLTAIWGQQQAELYLNNLTQSKTDNTFTANFGGGSGDGDYHLATDDDCSISGGTVFSAPSTITVTIDGSDNNSCTVELTRDGDSIFSSHTYTTYIGVDAVIYDTNDGDWSDGAAFDRYVIDGSTITLTNKVPVREGYEFLGWCDDGTTPDTKSCTNIYEAGKDYNAVSSTATLYALWGEVQDDLVIDNFVQDADANTFTFDYSGGNGDGAYSLVVSGTEQGSLVCAVTAGAPSDDTPGTATVTLTKNGVCNIVLSKAGDNVYLDADDALENRYVGRLHYNAQTGDLSAGANRYALAESTITLSTAATSSNSVFLGWCDEPTLTKKCSGYTYEAEDETYEIPSGYGVTELYAQFAIKPTVVSFGSPVQAPDSDVFSIAYSGGNDGAYSITDDNDTVCQVGAFDDEYNAGTVNVTLRTAGVCALTLDRDGGNTYLANSSELLLPERTAVFSNNVYSVNFNANGGNFTTTPDSRLVLSGNEISLPSANNQTKADSVFLGWCDDWNAGNSECDDPVIGVNETAYTVTSTVTLTAVWAQEQAPLTLTDETQSFTANTFTVKYSGGSGDGAYELSVDAGSSTVCALSGSAVDNSTYYTQTIAASSAGNCILSLDKAGDDNYAAAIQVSETYVIDAFTLAYNGGTYSSGNTLTSMFVLDGSTIELPVIALTGYEFVGWCDNASDIANNCINANLTGTLETTYQVDATGITLTAMWIQIQDPLVFTSAVMSGDSVFTTTLSGGHASGTFAVSIDASLSAICTLSSAANNASIEVAIQGPGACVISATKTYAGYADVTNTLTVNLYSLTFGLKGGNISGETTDVTITAISGASVTLPTPTKSDVVLGGWCLGTATGNSCVGDTVASSQSTYVVDATRTLEAMWGAEPGTNSLDTSAVATAGVGLFTIPFAHDGSVYSQGDFTLTISNASICQFSDGSSVLTAAYDTSDLAVIKMLDEGDCGLTLTQAGDASYVAPAPVEKHVDVAKVTYVVDANSIFNDVTTDTDELVPAGVIVIAPVSPGNQAVGEINYYFAGWCLSTLADDDVDDAGQSGMDSVLDTCGSNAEIAAGGNLSVTENVTYAAIWSLTQPGPVSAPLSLVFGTGFEAFEHAAELGRAQSDEADNDNEPEPLQGVQAQSEEQAQDEAAKSAEIEAGAERLRALLTAPML